MRSAHSTLASAILLATLVAHSADTHPSSLDGHPSVTQYLSNEAPFVVFGVTPTQLGGGEDRIVLTFIATDPLEQVHVFPFVRRTRDAPAHLRSQVVCGPRDSGSWNCPIPVAELLQGLPDSGAEIGLRIEAHGDPRRPAEHSTVIVTVPVRPLATPHGALKRRTTGGASARRAQ